MNLDDLIPMPSIAKQATDALMLRVMGKKEQEIKDVLDAHLPPGWTLEDVKRRCSIVTYGNVQELRLDGVAVLEIHPIEFGESVFDERQQCWRQTITQRFRRLPVTVDGNHS